MSQFESSYLRASLTDPTQLPPEREIHSPLSKFETAARSEVNQTHQGDIVSLELPPSFTFSNKSGEPTLVTIKRSTDPSKQIALDINFYAIQNIDGTRHTFELHFVEFHQGHTALRGEVRELGLSELVSGPQNPEPNPILLSFLLRGTESDLGETHSLQQMAQTLVELFAEQSVLGVFDGLTRTQRNHDSADQWVQVGVRFEHELLSTGRIVPEHAEPPTEFLPSKEEIDHTDFSPSEITSPNRLDESLLLIQIICDDELQRIEIDAQPNNNAHWQEDESEAETAADESRFFSESLKFIIGKLRANFFSSREKKSEQTIVSLKLPVRNKVNNCDLSHLTIEVSGPRNILWLRETYAVKDTRNLLAISSFGNNDEFFRNLFRALHSANKSELLPHQKLATVIDLIEAYDLKMTPRNIPALCGTLWRRFMLPAAVAPRLKDRESRTAT